MTRKKHIILSGTATESLSQEQNGKSPVYNHSTGDFDLSRIGGNLYYQSECPSGYTPDEIPLGSFWYNSITGNLYVRIYHESSDQYLWVTPSVECCGGISFFYRTTCPDIEPGEILPGSLWYNAETGILSVYIYDSDSSQYLWVTPAINCCDGESGTSGPTGPAGMGFSRAKITLSDSDIRSINSTPVTVISAPPIGSMILANSAVVKYNYGGTPFSPSGGSSYGFLLSIDGTPSYLFDSGDILSEIQNQIRQLEPVNNSNINNSASALRISGSNDFTGGDGSSVEVYVTYMILPL